MRGKIIQYNGADGSGTLAIEGKQHPFALAAWRGDSAPAVNRTVEVDFDDGAITAITAVGDDVLLKEKAAELGGRLGALWSRIPAAAGAGSTPTNDAAPGIAAGNAAAPSATGGAALAGSFLQRYGKAIPIAWALFVLGTFAFNVVTVQMPMLGNGFGKSFFDVADLYGQLGGSGGGSIKLLLILGYISIAIPMVWRDRRAWLTLAIPLLAVIWAIFSVIHTLDSFGGRAAEGMSDFFSLGFGFYLSLLAAIALAGLGAKRSLGAA